MGVNKVVYDGDTLIDLTGDTVTSESLAEGVTAHAANGERIVGTGVYMKPSVYDPQGKEQDVFAYADSKANERAKIGSANNLIHSGNEFTIVPAGYNNQIYINYRTADGTNGNISNYHFCNASTGYATVIANYFKGKFQGSEERLNYNNKEVAMLSDIPKSTTITATLYASGWSNGSYTLSVSGVTATSNQELIPALNITAAQLAALQEANIQDGGQAAGQITLKAFGTVPTIDVPIRIIVRGDA